MFPPPNPVCLRCDRKNIIWNRLGEVIDKENKTRYIREHGRICLSCRKYDPRQGRLFK